MRTLAALTDSERGILICLFSITAGKKEKFRRERRAASRRQASPFLQKQTADSLRAGLKKRGGRIHTFPGTDGVRLALRESATKVSIRRCFHAAAPHPPEPQRRFTLEEIVFCVLVRVIRAADNVERRAARHHLEHQHAQRPPVHAEACNTRRQKR